MNRHHRFGLLLSPAEKHMLELLAEAEGGLSQAATLRRLIREAAIEHGLWPPKQEVRS
jgi:hypothetical protein